MCVCSIKGASVYCTEEDPPDPVKKGSIQRELTHVFADVWGVRVGETRNDIDVSALGRERRAHVCVCV